jgi:hypothetical protein
LPAQGDFPKSISHEVSAVKKFNSFLLVVIAFTLLFSPCVPSSVQAGTPTTAGAAYPAPWPKVFDRNGAHIVVYQPQIRTWRSYRSLIADTAVSIAQNNAKPILGVISWHADTITDVSTRTVFVRSIEVASSRFPALDATQEAAMQARVRQTYPTMTFTISLDRMIAGVEKANDPVHSIPPTRKRRLSS